jgi:hypothetical protein
MRRASAIVFGFLALPSVARADKFDSTLDIAATATSALVQTGGDLAGQWFATGLVDRIGLSHRGLRLGASFGFLGAPSASTTPGTIWGVPFEAFAGCAFGKARRPQPYVELRASAIHVFSPTNSGVPSTWAFSLMPRIGVRIPLGEYFFVDFGVGAGVGAEKIHISWGFGIPIPTANL